MKLLLHAGPMKTGSTAFQELLVLNCSLLEQGGITRSVVTEAEIGSNGDSFGLQGVQQDGFNKGFRTEGCQLRREWHQHQLPDAERLKKTELFVGQIQSQPWFSVENLAWVRPEAHHARHRPGVGDGLTDHLAMADVKAVEAAQC